MPPESVIVLCTSCRSAHVLKTVRSTIGYSDESDKIVRHNEHDENAPTEITDNYIENVPNQCSENRMYVSSSKLLSKHSSRVRLYRSFDSSSVCSLSLNDRSKLKCVKTFSTTG